MITEVLSSVARALSKGEGIVARAGSPLKPEEWPEPAIKVREIGQVRAVPTIGVDAASATLMVAGGELGIASYAVVGPEISVTYPHTHIPPSSGPPFVAATAGEDRLGVTTRYIKIGKRFADDPDLVMGVPTADIRIGLENEALRKAVGRAEEGWLVVVDGPPSHSPSVEDVMWAEEVRELYAGRASLVRMACSSGVSVAFVVKRVWGVSWLGHNLADHDVLALALRGAAGPALLLGEVEALRAGVRYVVIYVAVRHAPYRGYSVFRVEVPECSPMSPEDVASLMARSALSSGMPVPAPIHSADYVSKVIAKYLARQAEAALRVAGAALIYGGGEVV